MSLNNITRVRVATPSSTSFEFTTNDVNDSLVAVFAAIATTGDFTQPPSTLTDTAGNTWNLVYAEINNVGLVSGVYNAIAAYVCNACVAATDNTLDIPTELQPVDALGTWSNGVEYNSIFPGLKFGNVQFSSSASSNFTLSNSINPASQIAIFASFDSGLIGNDFETNSTFNLLTAEYNVSPVADSGNAWINDWTFFNYLGGGTLETPVHINTAQDVFTIVLVLSGGASVNPNGPATGGANAQTLVFSINKGPDPIFPKEGRAIATVEIDCTQQVVTPFPIQYPEYANFGDNSSEEVGAVVCEFDLEHLFQGSGLSEVRTVMCWARPGFNLFDSTNREDVASQDIGFAFPAMLTNKTTLQTVLFGTAASQGIENDADNSYASYTILPFPGNKNSLKYRFICLQSSLLSPIGKFTIQFLNFEVMGAVDSSQGGLIDIFTGE